MRKVNRRTLPAAAALLRHTRPEVKDGTKAAAAAVDAIVRVFRAWREREQLRRELCGMSQRDFGDIAVPPAEIRDEVRRWPWQKPVLGAADSGGRQGPARPLNAVGIDVMQCILSPFVTVPAEAQLQRAVSGGPEAVDAGGRPAQRPSRQ